MSRAVIVLGGSVSDYDYIRSLFKSDDFVICADGGLVHLQAMGISPDCWIGDMDSCSMNDELFESLTANCEVIRLNPVKDATDGESACDYAINKGFKEVLVTAFGGTRLDHVMCNVLLLKKFADASVDAYAVNENNRIFFAKRHNVIYNDGYDYISLLPVSDCIENVSNSGLYYSLDNENLSKYSSRGLSNVFVEEKCTVDIGKGDAIIILSKD